MFAIYAMARKRDDGLSKEVDRHLADLQNESSPNSQAYGLEMLMMAVHPAGEAMVDLVLRRFLEVCSRMPASASKRNWFLRNVAYMIAYTWPEKAVPIAELIDRPISRKNCLDGLAAGKTNRPRRFIEDII